MSTPSTAAAGPSFYASQHADSVMPLRAAPPSGATAQALCTRGVVTVDEDSMVADAARRMRDAQVGALVVVWEPSPGRRIVSGIVTDRDIATRLVAADRDAHAFRVGDLMTRDVITARPDDTALDLLAVMERQRVRRMPVVGPQAELIGIVTAGDLVAALGSQVQALAGAVRSAQRRKV